MQDRPAPIPFRHLFSIWWLRTWRGALGGTVAVAPFALGFYLFQRAGVQSLWLDILEPVVIVLIGAAVAFAVSRMTLTGRYRDFRIALLPLGGDGPELTLSHRRVLAFWWFLVWRVTLGAAVIGIATGRAAMVLPPGWLLPTLKIVLILGWEFWMLRLALTRRYRDFRIALITEPLQR